MKKGGRGGSATQKAGEVFENKTLENLLASFQKNGFVLDSILKGGQNPRALFLKNEAGKLVDIFLQAAVHTHFFKPRGINSDDYFSAELRPDTAIFSHSANTLTIIEKKQQTGAGSVAEKLQTCDYKMQYYTTLCKPIGVRVDLIWQLGQYFVDNKIALRSVFEYMKSKGSRHFFLEVPFEALHI